MRTLSMRIGGKPASALEWRDTADILVIPLDEFGEECLRQAQSLDAALWREERRLRILRPGIAESEGAVPLLPGRGESRATAHPKLAKFFNAEATPEGEVDHCILLGSLMEPESAEWSLAFFEALFFDPRLLHLWRACALWACSETTTSLDYTGYGGAMKKAQKILGKIDTLHATTTGKPWQRETPQVIIGRTGSATAALLPREESALVVALGLLCRIYEIRGRLGRPEDELVGNVIPFFCGGPGDPETPFVHLGASLIAAHPSLLARAAAADLARGLFETLADQAAPEPDLGPRLDQHRHDLAHKIDHAAQAAMAETGRMAQSMGLAVKEGGLSVEWLARELKRDDLIEQWKLQVEESFGWDRFSALPLESWDQCLQEVDSLTTRFFDDQMAGYLKRFENAWPSLFQAGVARVLGEVAAGEMLTAEGTMRPHLMVRSVLHRLRELVEEGRRKDEQARRDEEDGSAMGEVSLDLEKFPSLIQDHLLALKRTLRSIPSPLAFYARLPVILAIALAASEWFDLGLTPNLAPDLRFLANCGIGLGAGLVFWLYLYIRMRRIKSGLEEKYTQWLTLVHEYHEQRFRNAARRSRALIWDLSTIWCDWVADPAPPGDRQSLAAYAGEQSQGWPEHLREALDAMTPASSLHAYLHDYKTTLPEAAEHCETLVSAALRSLGGVRRKLLLPPFDETIQGVAHFRSWLSQKKLVPGADADGAAWCQFLGDFMRRTPALPREKALFLVTDLPRDGGTGDPLEWRMDLAATPDLPSPEDFSRSDESVPATFEPLVSRLLQSAEISRPAEDLIDDWCYHEEDGKKTLHSDVKRRLELCDPSSPAGTQVQRCAVVPTEHRLIESISGNSDRVFTVGSLTFFGFLSVARGVSLAEAVGNFSVTGSSTPPARTPAKKAQPRKKRAASPKTKEAKGE